MTAQTAELGRLIDYLDARKVRVTAVLMPLGSWHHDLPYPAAYREQVVSICNARDVPLVDLAGLLSDDQFSDSCHFNYSGQRQLHPVLMEIALSHLAQTGATSPAGSTLAGKAVVAASDDTLSSGGRPYVGLSAASGRGRRTVGR